MKIEQLDPQQIELHQALEGIPLAPADVAEPIVADIKVRGIDQPLIVNQRNELIDGRVRLRGAIAAGLPTVPVIRRSDAEAATIIWSSLLHRTHYSKSALAYIAFPLLSDVVQESKSRRIENLKRGEELPDSLLSRLSGRTTEDVARALGISRALFFQAQDLHAQFAKHPNFKAILESQILAGEIGLGAAVAGLAGLIATKGKARNASSAQTDFFAKLFTSIKSRFAHWKALGEDERVFVANEFAMTAEDWPAEVQERVTQKLKALKKAEAAQ